ncbi:substrate-binding domain-containing protein [Streptomyces litchfieldiae]|uniref:Substrate-binding domain-containing protein n=1 Tax=Streptomyces litchfieldiae TaxID=3075543 RepID=A0ABU2MK10_9ACTN|nr:substrate-binding domain-containing protein [Streptomyces sp. DSM 44938]MDT0341947.1 substrate-binding domain-containing protein [Streptomyces sp. DSM 44938]
MNRPAIGAGPRSLTALAAALLLLLSACAASAEENTTTACVTTLFPAGTFAEFADALTAEGERHDITFDIQDVGSDPGREYEVLAACDTRQADIAIVSAVSPTGSLATLRRLHDRGTPVICYNTCLAPPHDEAETTAFVTNDQRELGLSTGSAAADYIREHLGGSARVGYLTCETYEVCQERREGLDAGLAEVDADIVASQEGFAVERATPVATSMLAAHPDIDVLIAQNEDGVIAAANAVRARGLTGRTVVFGIGMNPTVGELLLSDDGTVRMTTGQDPASWAAEVVEITVALREGRRPATYLHNIPGPRFRHDDPGPVQQYLALHSE